jgi:hypothetical protein
VIFTTVFVRLTTVHPNTNIHGSSKTSEQDSAVGVRSVVLFNGMRYGGVCKGVGNNVVE